MRARVVVLIGVALAAFLVVAAVAFAASKSVVNNGKLYMGGSGGQTVDFTVAKNGKSLVDFQGPGSPKIECGPAVSALTWPKTVKLSGDKFTITMKESGPNQQTVTGRFHANGRVTGTIKETTECLLPPLFRSGPVKHSTQLWSGTSDPMGKDSEYCNGRSRHFADKGVFNFSGIVGVEVTCPVIDHAIGAGTFTTTGTTPQTEDFFGEFSTPGWTCVKTTTGLYHPYTCTRTAKVKHKTVKETFTFVNGD